MLAASIPAAAYAFHSGKSLVVYTLYPEGSFSFTLMTLSSMARPTTDSITVPTVPVLPFSFTSSTTRLFAFRPW